MVKPKVAFRSVYKEYSMLKSNKDKLLDFLIPRKKSKSFFAIKDVNFEVYPGETIGIIGINGSGKSTVSNLLAEVIPPTAGSIEIDGETSLIAISVGLNGQLSGLENIQLKCMMHGMTEKEIAIVMPQIIEFADIGNFIEQPVKNYSSGMKSRLGFAVSVHTNPDVLVVDEALSVGDQTFYDKCLKKINEFKQAGKTIFFVSHSAGQMRNIADRVIWMHYGTIREFGEAKFVLEKYTSFIKWFNRLDETDKKKYKEEMFSKQLAGRDSSREFNVKKTLTVEEKKNRKWFSFQFVTLGLILSLLMILMITGTTISSAWGKISTTIGQDMGVEKKEDIKSKDNNLMVLPIEKDGYVIEDKSSYFSDIGLSENKKNINLFTKIYVIEEQEEIYKIRINQEEGFINKSSVEINLKSKTSSLTVEEILPYLSDQFREAYLYYLSFIGKDFEDVNNKLLYAESIVREDGTKGLYLMDSEIKYYANQNEEMIELEVPLEHDMSASLLDSVKEEVLKDKDGNKFYVLGNTYSYLIDFENDTINFILKDSK